MPAHEEATISLWIGARPISLWVSAINARANVTFSSGSIVNIKLTSLEGRFFSVLMELDSGTGFIEQSGFQNNISGARRSRMIVDGTLLIIFLGICVRAAGRLNDLRKRQSTEYISKPADLESMSKEVEYLRSEVRRLEQPLHDLESTTVLWYLVAFFFGIIGGLIGYVAVRDKDKGRNLLVIGVIKSAIIWFLIVYVYMMMQFSYY